LPITYEVGQFLVADDMFSLRQVNGRNVDEIGWRYGQPTKKVQGDNRQQPSVARCPQSVESQIFRDHPELRMGWRHYLRLDLRGVVVLGGCDGSLLPSYRGVVDEQMHLQALGHGCVNHGDLATKTFSGPYLSFGQGQPVLQP
jgi:hypothetical protein